MAWVIFIVGWLIPFSYLLKRLTGRPPDRAQAPRRHPLHGLDRDLPRADARWCSPSISKANVFPIGLREILVTAGFFALFVLGRNRFLARYGRRLVRAGNRAARVRRPRGTIGGVISVEEALERILARVATLGDERVALIEALDRVLAEPVVADREVPPWPNSSMDGYAVVSADTRDAARERPARLRLAGRVRPGTWRIARSTAGETFRIFTGAPLPDGADAVIPQEDVEVEGEEVRVPRPVPGGDYVRPRGEDMRPGDRLLEPGRSLIAPADIGVLATLGRSQVRVIRRPTRGHPVHRRRDRGPGRRHRARADPQLEHVLPHRPGAGGGRGARQSRRGARPAGGHRGAPALGARLRSR